MRQAGFAPPGWLAAPLLILLLLTFVLPVAAMLWRGVADGAVAPALPRSVAALQAWDGHALPNDAAFAALVSDLRAPPAPAALQAAATRLNQDTAGLRGVLLRTAGAALDGAPRPALLAADPAWGMIETWGAIRRASGAVTDAHLLAALDLRRDAAGVIQPVAAEQALFRGVFRRSFGVAALVTVICLTLAYPTAALLARLPGWAAGVLMIALLPFWTGVIVRTAAWMALLARQGVINDGLIALGVLSQPLDLLFTRFAVVIAMVHILLPFAVLPAYTVMRQIADGQMRAASSLGAGPLRRFLHVWLPQSLPGIGAGGLLVFIQSLGFYVTPALLGGGGDQMLPYFIGFYANRTLDWGMAAALSILLLAAVAILGVIWTRAIGLGLARHA